MKLAVTIPLILCLNSELALGETKPESLEMPTSGLARDYCSAFVKEAEKARESRQKNELTDLNDRLDTKLAEIKERTAALENWVTRREAILAEASSSVLKIYDIMDPPFAAQELSKLDLVTVSVILRKMKAKKSSAILKEMDPLMAARIIAVISSEANLQGAQK